MPQMHSAAGKMRNTKEVSKEVALATAYKLDSGLPLDLRKWTLNKIDRSSGGIPMEPTGEKSLTVEQQAEKAQAAHREKIAQVLKDTKINLAQKEKLARSMLSGDLEDVARLSPGGMHNSASAPNLATGNANEFEPHMDRLVKHVYETDLVKGTANVNRARMKSEAFLSTTGKQAPIFLADRRMVMLLEREKNVKCAKTPAKDREGRQFAWAGKSVSERMQPLYVGNSQRDLNRVLEEKFVTEKKNMFLHQRDLHLMRGRQEKMQVTKLIEDEKRRKINQTLTKQERRRYVEEFRQKLKEHLIKTKDPMMGTIMRYVNHEVAWNVLETYKGYTMSMKAVVGLVGQTLGDMEVDADEAVDEEIEIEQTGGEVLDNLDGITLGDESLASAVNSVTQPVFPTEDNAEPVASNFEGENVYLTGLPPEQQNPDRNPLASQGDTIITPRQKNQTRTDESIDDSTMASVDISLRPSSIPNVREFVKPRTPGNCKSVARDNVFAPAGMEKHASAQLPHNAELATYRLGSTHASRGATPGSPNRMRGTLNSRGEAAEAPRVKAYEDHQQWNSDEINPIDPLDKICTDKQTGRIENTNAWYANPGSRGPAAEPSALGIKGWNARTPTTRKMAGGFVVSVSDGRDVKYGGRVERANTGAAVYESEDYAQSQTTVNNLSDSEFMGGYSAYMRDMEKSGSLEGNTRSVETNHHEAQAAQASLALMDAIEQEKIALGTIPRMQPERALSDSHLHDLGTGKATIDSIAAQMRWAKEKRQRQQEMATSPTEKPSTSNTMGELNALTSNMPPSGGIGIKVNEFTNMDVALGFRPEDGPAPAADDSGLSEVPKKTTTNTKSETAGSLYSLENPRELSRLVDANTRAPPKQLKSLARPINPVSPFKSWEDKTRVQNCGVAAGMGLAVVLTDEMRKAKIRNWGPRVKSADGRFRTGGSSNKFGSEFSPNKESIEKRRRTGTMALP